MTLKKAFRRPPKRFVPPPRFDPEYYSRMLNYALYEARLRERERDRDQAVRATFSACIFAVAVIAAVLLVAAKYGEYI